MDIGIHWHKEGLTEKDIKLVGGDLWFRNKAQPEDWYEERGNYMPPLVHNVGYTKRNK